MSVSVAQRWALWFIPQLFLQTSPRRKRARVPCSSCRQETDGEADPCNVMDRRGHCSVPRSAATLGGWLRADGLQMSAL